MLARRARLILRLFDCSIIRSARHPSEAVSGRAVSPRAETKRAATLFRRGGSRRRRFYCTWRITRRVINGLRKFVNFKSVTYWGKKLF